MNLIIRFNYKRLLYIIPVILLVLAVAAGCGSDSMTDGKSGGSSDQVDRAEEREETSSKNAELARWTYMIYMAADNNLEDTAWQDMNKLEQIGSTTQVNILVQWDNRGQYGFPGCRRYYIRKNSGARVGDISSPALENLGEIDSANPDNLVEFVKWGMEKYPAEKYAVILWNHGAGWRNPSPGEVSSRAVGICFDKSSGGYMTAGQMSEAFEEIVGIRGTKLDFIGLDACLMGMVEIAHSLKDCGQYITFCESSIYGWPYHYILGDLTTAPQYDAEDLSKVTVSRFRQYWLETGPEYFTAISAVDPQQADGLTIAVNQFAQEAIKKSDRLGSEIKETMEQTEGIDRVYTDFKDLNLFMQGVGEKTQDPVLKEKAAQVQAAVKQMIVYEAHGEQFPDYTAGLTIWLPDREKLEKYKQDYFDLSFAQDTMWDEMLEKIESSAKAQSASK